MKPITAVAALMLTATQAHAEIVEATGDHYVLHHEERSTLSPSELWVRLIKPAEWWHPDHTYSGDAGNLSFDPQVGGLWREDWADGSVVHGRVLYVAPEKMLRLDAPFGPLQGMAVTAVWTITIKPDGDGSLVSFDEIASGTAASKLDALAPTVDFVKGEAIRRLTQVNNQGN